MYKSENFDSKSYFKINCVSLIFIYFVYSSIFVFLDKYFPILFFDVLDINRVLLALMQFLAYSILLLRPAFAAITDKYRIKGYQRKYYIIFSGYLLSLIYVLMGFSFSNILIFGVFLLLIFFSSTMLDVSTKSLIIDISPTNEIKKQYLFFTFVGEALGRSFPFFLFFFLINDIYSIGSWEILIFCSCLFLIPLLSILPFIRERNQLKTQDLNNIENNTPDNLDSSPNSKITLILLCIFLFFAFSDVIFSYPFFPFLLNKFGLNNFNLFNFFLIFCFLISIISSSIGAFIMKKANPKKIIIILIPVIGIIYILYTIVPFPFFLILYFIGWSLGTITNLNITVYAMKYKNGNKSTYFHLISSFRHLSIFILLPLGTLLSNFIVTEYLIIVGAILLNFSLLPLMFIKL